uniref:N-acetylmuramoyl-L-alanine amidase n=1 Tax=Enterocloster hominis (ex Hitch et al. 2024) TaxID=1917870 RepID=UPI0035302111
MPEFESVKDDVYVKTEDGGSVRLRSSCDTGSDANIVTYASSGTRLTRTGKGSEWTRIDYNGTPAYISSAFITTDVPETTAAPAGGVCVDSGEVTLNPSWKYAEFSKINTGAAVLYRSEAGTRKNITICVNAGHGTKGGSSVKTLCHPDGTPKVTGGTTGAGATSAAAVSGGMTFADGTAESKVTLAMARILKDKLLAAGYDVLMIRENDDVQLDNVARTVIANNASDCHIALHWDSTTSNKGAFYMSVPNVESYRNMEPVKSHWQQHNALGESLVAGLKGAGVKIFSGGSMAMDLTQTSYSTVPSVDIELGDKASDHSQATLNTLADGLLAGINQYFGQS